MYRIDLCGCGVELAAVIHLVEITCFDLVFDGADILQVGGFRGARNEGRGTIDDRRRMKSGIHHPFIEIECFGVISVEGDLALLYFYDVSRFEKIEGRECHCVFIGAAEMFYLIFEIVGEKAEYLFCSLSCEFFQSIKTVICRAAKIKCVDCQYPIDAAVSIVRISIAIKQT